MFFIIHSNFIFFIENISIFSSIRFILIFSNVHYLLFVININSIVVFVIFYIFCLVIVIVLTCFSMLNYPPGSLLFTPVFSWLVYLLHLHHQLSIHWVPTKTSNNYPSFSLHPLPHLNLLLKQLRHNILVSLSIEIYTYVFQCIDSWNNDLHDHFIH